MTFGRLWDRGGTRRLAAVDAYQFPGAVRQRLAFTYPDMTPEHMGKVEAAARQWFRIAARHPKAQLSMPSAAVDAFCRELIAHTREYQEFCAQALGRSDPLVPEHGSDALPATLRLAQEDEGCGPAVLPLLFRVDRETEVRDGWHYLVDCGGRGQCFDVVDAICLAHLTGVGKKPHGDWKGPDSRITGWHRFDAEGGGG
jgi:hypothetical protein